MSKLFSALTIKNICLKNRLVVSPMCQYSSEDGFATNWHLVHLGSRAVGGAGLVMSEATAVSREGRISIADLGIWKDAHIPKLTEIVDFIHKNNAIAGIQLAHAGRKASFDIPWLNPRQLSNENGGWSTVAPSPLPFHPDEKIPLALDQKGIEKVCADFTSAAIRAEAAGFKVIEIHAAHGYLLHQFLSPISNHRVDQYGGVFENRIRLLMEVVASVRSVWTSEKALFVRISATDWAEGGWTPGESVELAKRLALADVDLIDCSSGALTPIQKIPVAPGYQVPFARSVKAGAGIKTGAVGLITTAAQAEQILQNNEADLIFMARELLRDPYFPLHQLEADVPWPMQYDRARPIELNKNK